MFIDYQIARCLNDRAEHVLQPRVGRGEPTDQGSAPRCHAIASKEPMSVDQFRWLAGDQCDAADFARFARRDKVFGKRREVDDVGDGVGQAGGAVTQS